MKQLAILVLGRLAIATVCLGQTTIDTGFRPSTHGYRFQNFGQTNLLAIPVFNVTVPSAGNCYGFAARVTDHYIYGVPIPTNTSRTPEQEADLISRQWAFANEMPHVGLQMAGALLRNTLPADYQWLKSKLEAGQPWPIVGTGDPILYAGFGPFPLIHALVAYKIVENYQGVTGRHAIFLYDSNRPSDDNIAAIVEPVNGVFTLTSYWTFSWFTPLQAYTPISPATSTSTTRSTTSTTRSTTSTTRSTTSTTQSTTSTTRSTTSTTRSTTTTTIPVSAFSGAFDGGAGRKYLAWFGWYNDQHWPWIWDYEFGGWHWVVDNGPQNVWFWRNDQQRWMWTRTDWYRWVWYPGDAGLTWRTF